MLYVDGLEADRPLSITRNHYADASSTSGSETYAVYAPFSIIPLWNSQGRADQAVVGGTAAAGQDYLCVDTGKTRCADVFLDWGVFPYARSGAAMGSWNGTLLLDKPDAAGTYYRRNRSYDPATARFTQEDPIGLAGGINEYGFASGDPANYSDPFGLCADGDWKCELAKALYQVTGAVIGGAAGFTGGAAAGVVCGPLVEVCSPVMAVAGAVSVGGASAAAAGEAVDSYYDGANQMARGGKGRGGNANPNRDVHGIVKDFDLNKAGQRALHDEITGEDRDSVPDLA